MNDTKLSLRGGLSRKQEDALEGVSGGVPEFIKPSFPPLDPSAGSAHCPVCGEDVSISGDNARCMGCHRQFRVEGSTLVEVQP